jgi:transcriptional regulator with XRE-family HTH domain
MAVLSLSETIGKLKNERLRQGLTLAEVSQRAGLGIESLSLLEDDKEFDVPFGTLWRYADAVGMKLEFKVGPAAEVAQEVAGNPKQDQPA